MKKIFKYTGIGLLVLLIGTITYCSYRGFVEAEFTLATESRLPKWFEIPLGLTRDDVLVKITTYTPILRADNVKLTLETRDGKVLSDVDGYEYWHPQTEKRFGYGSFPSYPTYSVVTVNGISEIIEHKESGDILYISDDPELIKEINQKK